MAVVGAIGARPHVMGSAEDVAVGVDLVHRFAALGLQVTMQGVPSDEKSRAKVARWTGHAAPAGLAGQNVLALLPGRDRIQPAVLLMAHHDSVYGSPGAADDGIGVATLVETARALAQGPQPARDVLFLVTDGEELALLGARAFFATPGVATRIGAVLNFESRGAAGRAMMFETGANNGAMMRAFAGAVPWPSAASLAVFVYRQMPNSTDLTVPIRYGLPGFNFAIGDRAGVYHSPLATPERLSQASLQDMGQSALALTRALAFAPALPAKAADATFSDLWGSMLILYPARGGWVILVLAAGLAGFAARRVGVRAGDVAAGLAVPAILLAGGGLLLFLVNGLSGAGAAANYYDRLAALPRLEVQTGLLALAILVLLARWRASPWSGWLGSFVVIGVAGLVLQVLAPTATPILHWPLLLGGVAMALAAWLDPALERPHALAPIGLLAAAGAGQLLAIGHQLFLLVGAGLPEAVLVPLLGVALLAWPLIHRLIPARATRLVAGLCLIGAVALALWVRLDPIAPSVPVYAADKH